MELSSRPIYRQSRKRQFFRLPGDLLQRTEETVSELSNEGQQLEDLQTSVSSLQMFRHLLASSWAPLGVPQLQRVDEQSEVQVPCELSESCTERAGCGSSKHGAARWKFNHARSRERVGGLSAGCSNYGQFRLGLCVQHTVRRRHSCKNNTQYAMEAKAGM
jgi:hypothetical protein